MTYFVEKEGHVLSTITYPWVLDKDGLVHQSHFAELLDDPGNLPENAEWAEYKNLLNERNDLRKRCAKLQRDVKNLKKITEKIKRAVNLV